MAFAALLLLTLLGLSSAKHIKFGEATTALEEDLSTFLDLFPDDEVYKTVKYYVENDEEVRHIYEFMHEYNFKLLLANLEYVPQFVRILDYIQTRNINIYKIVNYINEQYELDPLTPMASRSLQRGTGFKGMMEDLMKLLPEEQIKSLYQEKMKSSPQYAEWVKTVKGEEFNALFAKLYDDEIFRFIEKLLHRYNVQFDLLGDFLYKVFGWGYF